MVDIKDYPQKKTANQSNDSNIIENNSRLDCFNVFNGVKGFQASTRQISRRTTVSSRAFARSNQPINSDVHSFNFTGMNTSTVVSTWCWSGPSVNIFIGNGDTHGEFSFDTLNQLPTSNELIEGIYNSDSFIKELNLGSMQNHVNELGGENPPSQGQDFAAQVAHHESLNNHNQNSTIGNAGSKNTTAWSKNIKIVHLPILSQKVEA